MKQLISAGGEMVPPTFLVGPARSGTSMVYKLLCLHPQAAFISNYVRRAPALPEIAVLNRISRVAPQRRRRAWFGTDDNAYVYGKPRAFSDWAFPSPVEGEPVFRHCGLVEYENQTPRPAREQAARMHGAFQRILKAGGGTHLINKRIANNRRIPELLSAFPSARFISLIRDGRAVALSLSQVDWWADGRVWFYGGTPKQWSEEGRNPWELCARNWVEELKAMDEGLAHVPPGQVLRIRYEDLLAAPQEGLERMGAFAGLPPSTRWQQSLAQVRMPAQNERWRQTFDPATLALIESIQSAHLDRLGYLQGQAAEVAS